MLEPKRTIKPRYFDMHFHLDLFSNADQVVKDIEESGIYTIAVTNTPSVFCNTYKLCENKKFVRPALGMHPELVSKRFGELDLMTKMINKTRYIGEVGLDYSNVTQEEKIFQRKIFQKILEICAQEKNKVLSVHTRKSAEDAIDMIGSNYPGKIILHWYSDNIKVLERAVIGGMYFSINHAMTVSNNGKKIINNIPCERIITESDGPFIQLANKPFLPMNIPVIVEKISQIKSISTDAINGSLYENVKKILQE